MHDTSSLVILATVHLSQVSDFARPTEPGAKCWNYAAIQVGKQNDDSGVTPVAPVDCSVHQTFDGRSCSRFAFLRLESGSLQSPAKYVAWVCKIFVGSIKEKRRGNAGVL